MRLPTILLSALTVSGLSACVIVDPLPVTGPSINGVPTTAPQGALSLQQLSGRTLVREGESHTLLPGGRVAGRFFVGLGEFWEANGSWSVSGNTFCFGVEVSDPFCGSAEISGNRLIHYSDGGTMTWVIE